MDTLKAILLKEQEDLESVLREIESDEFDVKESSAESAIEISDMADQFEERQNIYSQKEMILGRLKKIKEALERFEKGAYGKCIKCGGDIEEMRLKIDPSNETCRHCSVG
ncbi:MAG: TraR/DksA C4-type zinc finger protein [Patescibacteria group bacterium]